MKPRNLFRWMPWGGFAMRLLNGTRKHTYGDTAITVYRYRTDRPVTMAQVREILPVFHRECACEHDCCGHWFHRADSARLNGNREIRVVVRHGRNC